MKLKYLICKCLRAKLQHRLLYPSVWDFCLDHIFSSEIHHYFWFIFEPYVGLNKYFVPYWRPLSSELNLWLGLNAVSLENLEDISRNISTNISMTDLSHHSYPQILRFLLGHIWGNAWSMVPHFHAIWLVYQCFCLCL